MAQYDFDLREYWRIIRKKKFIIVFTTLAMGLFSFIFAILGSPTPLYKTSAAVKFERAGLASGLYLQSVSLSPGDDMQTQMAIIKSYYIIELTAKKLGLISEKLMSEEIRSNPKYFGIINKLKGKIETEQESQSSIINISVTSEDPRFAQRMANTLVMVYKEQRTFELNKRSIDARKFIEEQLKGAKEKLKTSENAVRDFREKNKIISIESQSGALMSQLGTYKTTYEKLSNDNVRIQEALRQLDKAEFHPLTSKTNFYIEEATAGYKALNDRLVQLLMDRDALLITFTENYPQVVEIKKRIHEMVISMRSQLSAQLRGLRDGLHDLKVRINDTDRQIKTLPDLGLELARLERNVRVDTDVYSLLEKSYQESLIKEAEKVEDVQIVRPALEPTSPMNPPKTNTTAGIGTILGLILGVVFAFLIETFDTSIGTIEEVESFLGVPVLGVIPQITSKDIKSSLEDKYSGKVDEATAERASRLMSHFAPQSTLAESYRAMRTNLSFACKDGDFKAIVFTSATPREGKTTTIVNLAITIAQTGQRVLLVEADLRKPVIASMFGIDQTPGLTDTLLGNLEWGKAVKTIADIMMGKLNIDEVLETPGMDNLHIIPAGTIPPNPAELVNSKSLNDFIEWGKANYDIVLIDAPPVLAATDAALLGSKADGVVIVYRVGKIARVTLRRAKSQLENVRAHIIGCILNGIKADISPDLIDYDYKYYHYYGGKEKDTSRLSKIKQGAVNALNSIKERLKREPSSKEADVTPEPEKPEAAAKTKEKRSGSGWKLFVFSIALVSLAAGTLYHLGYIKFQHLDSAYDSLRSLNPLAEKPRLDSVKKTISRPENKIIPVPSPAAPSKAAPVREKLPALLSESKPYSIQIRAVRDYDEAMLTVKGLLDRGMDAHVLKVDLKDAGIWHRILIGRFSTNDEAQRYLKEKKLAEQYPGSLVRNIAPVPAEGTSAERKQ